MHSIILFICSFLLVIIHGDDSILIGMLLSKAAKYKANSYCQEGFYFDIAARVALESVNSDEQLLHGRKLRVEMRDIMKDRYEALEATRDLITKHMNNSESTQIAVLMGPAEDDLNELVQLTAEQFTIPQISFESHSTELSNPTLYPMFIRLSASQDLVAISMLKLVQKYRWQRFNIIAPDDNQGSNAVEELKKAIDSMPEEFIDYISNPITIRYPSRISLPIATKDEESIMNSLHNIKKTGNRVNILYADPVQAAAFLYAASQQNMTGLGWVYIGTDWNSMQTFAGLSSSYKAIVQEAMDGMVGISPYIGDTKTLVNTFSAYLDRHHEIAESALSICGSSLVINREMFPEYTIFAYDAILTIAHAIHNLMEIDRNITFNTPESRKQLYDAILKVEFDGESGHVHFKEGVGDRLPVKMEVVNIYKGTIIDIGDADFTSATKYRFVIDKVPIWPGGSTAVPTDRADNSEEYLSLYMTLTLLWMIVAFVFGAFLERWQWHRLPESGAVVIFGIIAGLLIRMMGSHVSSTAVFDPSLFTLFLLPIIIFESGYNMKAKGIFFKNVGTILIYAIFGCVFSALVTGGLLSILFNFKWFDGISISPMECMIFGSLIAATDPVSTLAVFGALAVEPMLSMIIYGESVINDAVSIVMFRTMSNFLLSEMSFLAVLQALGTFLGMFIGSLCIGAAIALVTCLLLKYIDFHSVVIETIIVFLTAYTAFVLTEACKLSGITATLACGITMNYFGLRNLPKTSQDFSQKAVKVASSVADTLIFFQVGENVFLNESLSDIPWKLVIAVFIIINIARIIMVLGFTYLVNRKRTKSVISTNSQIMMIHAGLRGAIAYSLAVVFPSHNQTIITRHDIHIGMIPRVTMWIVILTIFTQGCTTYDMLHLLRIPLHCDYDTKAQSGGRQKRSVMTSSGSLAAWWVRSFEKYVIPFFTKDVSDLEEPLINSEDIDKEFVTRDSELSPMATEVVSARSRNTAASSMTRVIKGNDGKTYIESVADVEADGLGDEKDTFVISDEDVEQELKQTRDSNIDIKRLSIASNLSMRNSLLGSSSRS